VIEAFFTFARPERQREVEALITTEDLNADAARRYMAQPLSASMALAPLFDQRVPERLGRSPNCRHPPSTTPLPTWMPRSRNPPYRIRPRLFSK